MRQLAEIFHYHAHVYYPESSRAQAAQLREQIAERFSVQVGRMHDQAIGPHPCPQYEIGFLAEEFERLVPWLMLNHQEFSVLIHPNTDREREDHLQSAIWLGPAVPLDLNRLQVSLLAAEQSPPRAIKINSTPNCAI